MSTPEGRLTEPTRRRWAADPDAFDATFRRFYAPLVRYAARFTGSAASAADVVQDVFLKAWETRSTLVAEVSVQALLFTMVRNRALNANRRAKRIAANVDVEDALDTSRSVPSSDGQLAADDLRRHIRRWIDALPPRRGEAFNLSRVNGLSHAEIAAIMDVSARTVDTHILLALREIRSKLDDLLSEPDLDPADS